MSKLYGDNEEVVIRTLNEKLLSSFRLNEEVTITLKSASASHSFSCHVDELEDVDEVEDYSYPEKKGSKPKTKMRPGEICLVIGEEKPEDEGPDMASLMEEDDD